MKLLTCLFLIISAPALWALEPKPPREIRLDGHGIAEILINHRLTTVLLFPDPVAMVVGKGLTDGSVAGVVQYSNPAGSRTLVLRDLELTEMVIMQVMVGDEVFVFRLGHSDRPDTLVRLRKGEQQIAAREVPRAVAVGRRFEVSRERLEQLGKLARSRSILEPSLPQYYRGVTSKGTSWAHREQGLTFETREVHRFPGEDAIVLLGTIRNSNRGRLRVDTDSLRIRVGESRLYKPARAVLSTELIQGGNGSVTFELILVGDSKGRRLHLSADNRFNIELAK